jgi:hypothetical protein
MKVRCLSRSYTAQQRLEWGVKEFFNPEFEITPGEEYVVLGITSYAKDSPHGAGMFFEIQTAYGQCRSAPSCLSDVVDSRCSKYWMIRMNQDGGFVLWPEEFFAEFFHDDLSEGLKAAVDAFRQVVVRLYSEFP